MARIDMADSNISAYLAWITPAPGDPTHSLLRAHLLIEQLLDAFLERALAHPRALSDARLTFAQKLAIAKAAASSVIPSHWTWQAVTRLNKIRNTLAHSPGPKLVGDIREYVQFCVKNSGNPLPAAEKPLPTKSRSVGRAGSAYAAADLVTVGLYIALATRLGFNVDKFASP